MGGKLSRIRSIFGRCCGSCEGDGDNESDNPVFGVSLIQAQRSEKYPNIPNIVIECIEFIESANNIEKKGIYRISGQKTKIDQLKHIVIFNKPSTGMVSPLVFSIHCFPFLSSSIRFMSLAIMVKFNMRNWQQWRVYWSNTSANWNQTSCRAIILQRFSMVTQVKQITEFQAKWNKNDLFFI